MVSQDQDREMRGQISKNVFTMIFSRIVRRIHDEVHSLSYSAATNTFSVCCIRRFLSNSDLKERIYEFVLFGDVAEEPQANYFCKTGIA